MKKLIPVISLLFIVAVSCSDNETPTPSGPTERTVFMYLPWANDLYIDFLTNIADFEKAIARGILVNDRVLVFLHTSATQATLFELKYENKQSVRETLKTYNNPAYTTAAGIASIINDVKNYSPASKYSMIIGCHGMGWIPVESMTRVEASEELNPVMEGALPTRWFGGTSNEYRTDITTLAEGITAAGVKMEYILFDDCYMSSIETAYDLRKVTDYLIGCPTEVMAYGMPYEAMAPHLTGKVDYQAATDAFYDFYSNYTAMPCGTIAVTVCSELDNLAAVMKEINGAFTFDGSKLGSVQRMDGYNPQRFLDYGDYVAKLCTDETLLARFDAQLEKTLPTRFRKHTPQFYTMSSGRITINTFSGTTTSDPSVSSMTASKTGTAWYAATHE